MVLAPLLTSALALTSDAPRPWSCELLPSLGRGKSEEGTIETLSTIGADCRYTILEWGSLELSPGLGLHKASWSIPSNNAGQKNLSSFETQDILFSLRLSQHISDKVSAFYTVKTGNGRGSLTTTESTESSSIQGRFTSLTQKQLSHTLGMSYDFDERFAFSLAWQWTNADQSWQANASDLAVQSVASDMSMTLTDGESTNLVGNRLRTANHTETHALQFGLSFRFGN